MNCGFEMFTSIAMDERSRLVSIEISGPTDFEDVRHLQENLGGGFEGRHFSLLVDLSRADLRLDMPAVRSIAQWKLSFDRIAIVAGDDAQYGMARAYETYSELVGACSVDVFRGRGEALQWMSDAGFEQ
jgi:hypothetical protein